VKNEEVKTLNNAKAQQLFTFHFSLLTSFYYLCSRKIEV